MLATSLLPRAAPLPGRRHYGVDWVPAPAVRERGGDERDRPLGRHGAARPARPQGDRPAGIFRLGRHRHFVRERRGQHTRGRGAREGGLQRGRPAVPRAPPRAPAPTSAKQSQPQPTSANLRHPFGAPPPTDFSRAFNHEVVIL